MVSNPYSSSKIAFWSASLTIASWASIVHRTIKKGSKNPISGLTAYYIAFNVIDIALVCCCWVMILSTEDISTIQTWSKVGQSALAIPEVLLAISSLVYGTILMARIRDSMAKFAKNESDQKAQVKAVHKTGAVMICFSLAFLCQATLEIIAGWFPHVYLEEILLGGHKIYAMSPMNAAYALFSLITATIIVFVTVKYEELKIIAHDIGAPLISLAHRVSGKWSYQKIEQDIN